MTKEKMFIETDIERAEKIKEYLNEHQLNYHEKSIHELIHLDIENMSDEQRIELKNYYLCLKSSPIEVRHRKWDDKFHTPKEEIIGTFTGKNMEEDVEYISR